MKKAFNPAVMEKVLNGLVETGISIVLVVVVLAVCFFAFKDLYPYDTEIQEAKQYVKLEKEKYKVVGDIQNAQNATETFETTSSELDMSQTEIRYVPGSTNPFVAEQNGTDLPTEVVGVTPSEE